MMCKKNPKMLILIKGTWINKNEVMFWPFHLVIWKDKVIHYIGIMYLFVFCMCLFFSTQFQKDMSCINRTLNFIFMDFLEADHEWQWYWTYSTIRQGCPALLLSLGWESSYQRRAWQSFQYFWFHPITK